ncbi:uncharacterized protein LOC115268007 [Aedes albopictus]|uniref:Uncharacterized protein n=1 Tax=Aedes albopictus TaxID=7160 RepID=A0ABM1Y587_AEDAL
MECKKCLLPVATKDQPYIYCNALCAAPTYVLQRDVDELKAKVASILSVITSHENNHSDTRICHSTPNSSRQKEEGTSEIAHAFDTASRLPDSICDDENFDLLLTNIDGSVSEEDVHLMISRCLGTFENERINVRKLVPRWVDCSALDYVSFKIVLNRKWKSAAMMSSTWPGNIRFREFKKLRCPWKPDIL